ncbi:lipocalin family protein [Roseobacter sp.]|uniref:lipocalin family protein n=1 Tax=Roseobacter sp. TaxID=1907202 RepID=UPI003297D282
MRHVFSAGRRVQSAICGAVLGVASCAPPMGVGFRDTSVPITATTRFTPDAFAGVWHVVAQYPSGLFPDCAGQTWFVDPKTAAFTVACDGVPAYSATAQVDPRGVIQLQTPPLGPSTRGLWVMWMDEDAQTAVVGTPSGELGWIINRSAALRSDRFVAAREIMAFNGYDVQNLKETGR